MGGARTLGNDYLFYGAPQLGRRFVGCFGRELMEPIFDRSCKLVGWLNADSGFVFSTRMQFVAFTRVMDYSQIVVGISASS